MEETEIIEPINIEDISTKNGQLEDDGAYAD